MAPRTQDRTRQCLVVAVMVVMMVVVAGAIHPPSAGPIIAVRQIPRPVVVMMVVVMVVRGVLHRYQPRLAGRLRIGQA